MEDFCVLLDCAVVAAEASILERFGGVKLVARNANDAGEEFFVVKPFLSDLLHDVLCAHFDFVFDFESSCGFEIVILKLLGDD